MSGDVIVGSSAQQTLPTTPGDAKIDADIMVNLSTLRAELTVTGKNCGDAGVSSFDVDVYEQIEPLNLVRINENSIEVPCASGKATFEVANLHAGALHVLKAFAPSVATRGYGQGFVAEGFVTTVVADLLPVFE
jgi:hypothetical protein